MKVCFLSVSTTVFIISWFLKFLENKNTYLLTTLPNNSKPFFNFNLPPQTPGNLLPFSFRLLCLLQINNLSNKSHLTLFFCWRLATWHALSNLHMLQAVSNHHFHFEVSSSSNSYRSEASLDHLCFFLYRQRGEEAIKQQTKIVERR